MLNRFRQLLQPIEGTARADSADATILVCEFRGVIKEGSSGNPQVEQMNQIINRAMAGAAFKSIVLDLGQVQYTFGDHVLGLLADLRDRNLASALVVSDRCRQLADFARRIGGWAVCGTREEALEKLRSRPAGGDA